MSESSSSAVTVRLHDRYLGAPEVAAHFSVRAQVQAMLDVEAALAESQAACGMVPNECVAPIRAAAEVDLYDCDALIDELANAGAPAVPVVKALTAEVARTDPKAAKFVHWGGTTQDVTDTALVLQLRQAVPMVIGRLDEAAAAAAALARRHADVPMAGRTWLQQATPVSFGLKAAGWLDGLARVTATLRVALDDLLVLQFGGATGTLASMGPSALLVEAELASRLNLSVADTPWHAQRDRLGHLGSALGVAVGIAGKVARDVALLAQSEVGEAWEQGAAGRGRSSTMPQKRNPMGASVALAAAVRVPGLVASLLHALPQEHERGLGGWQAEWDLVPDLVIVAASGAGGVADSLTRLEIDPDRMRAKLEASRGLPLAESVSMALAASVGKEEAHHLVARACRRVAEEGRSLAEVLTDDETVAAHLDGDEIRRRLDPRRYLGQSQAFIDRVLARWETKR